MKLFFAGAESTSFQEVLRNNGVENVLQSAFSLGFKSAPNSGGFANFLLDSGGFSARQHGIAIDVKEYAKFLNRFRVKFAFNLDVVDLRTSIENQDYLIRNTETYILPVYHGTEWLDPKTRDLLDYYAECFPYIALGGMAGKENSQANTRRFLNYVFSRTKNEVMVHGLGMTGVRTLQNFPAFSADSTSWMSVNRFGASRVYSEEMSKVRNRTRHYLERFGPEIKHWLAFEDKMTRLWESRGVRWNGLDYDELMAKRKIMTYEEWKEKNAGF